MSTKQNSKEEMKNTPLQLQIDNFLAQGMAQLPPELIKTLLDSIEQLTASGIAEQTLKKGERVPDFTLPDALGNLVTLSTLLQKGPLVLTFYRGTWCPYCNLQLRFYQQYMPDIQALGATLVAVSPQTPDHSLTLAEKEVLTFPVLSDNDNQVARKFGLVFSLDEVMQAAYKQLGADLPSYNGNESWELPMPGTFIIDQSRIIHLAFVDPNFTRRLEPSAIITTLKSMKDEKESL